MNRLFAFLGLGSCMLGSTFHVLLMIQTICYNIIYKVQETTTSPSWYVLYNNSPLITFVMGILLMVVGTSIFSYGGDINERF